MSLSYEEQRLQNIKDNEALLLSLGLAPPAAPKPKKTVARPRAKDLNKLKKRTNDAYVDKGENQDSESESEPDSRRRSKRAKPNKSKEDNTPRRRSTRQSIAPVRHVALSDGDYDDNTDSDDEDKGKRSYKPSAYRRVSEPQRFAQRLGVRTQDPKQFGHIPGVKVGTWWESRMDCSTAAVHGPPVAGISGNYENGAWSVALSGGYPDDVDLGEAFTYTGSGGRDLKGTSTAPKNLRTAPQTFDQSFETPTNAALKKSAETHKPVRVIRGFKLDSPYAPVQGYRYDGLYVVERAWMAPGLTKGLKVCRYAFKRVAGQPPLPVRGDEEEEEEEVAEDEERGDDADQEAREPNGKQSEEEEVQPPPKQSKKSRLSVVMPTRNAIESEEEEEEEKVQPEPKKSKRNRLSVVMPTRNTVKTDDETASPEPNNESRNRVSVVIPIRSGRSSANATPNGKSTPKNNSKVASTPSKYESPARPTRSRRSSMKA